MANICASDARVGPDALVWAAGRQPGGSWKLSFVWSGGRGVYPYAKLQATAHPAEWPPSANDHQPSAIC